MSQLPPEFLERLQQIIPEQNFSTVLETFAQAHPLWIRINILKTSVSEIKTIFADHAIEFECATFYEFAFKVKRESIKQPLWEELIQKGWIYPQNISSMLPVLILNPQPNEKIWDICAAPGSKTSQMAMQMNNQGEIVATDVVPKRMFKLRAVLNLLGVTMAQTICCDGRRYKAKDKLFDRVLVDAPCSSEGRFDVNDEDSMAYWSPRKIKEMVQKQRGILLSASRRLRSGGTLLYSTCTFSPEENEAVVDWFLKKTTVPFEVLQIDLPKDILTYPAILNWGKRNFNPDLIHCHRILPTAEFDGFFMVLLRRKSL